VFGDTSSLCIKMNINNTNKRPSLIYSRVYRYVRYALLCSSLSIFSPYVSADFFDFLDNNSLTHGNRYAFVPATDQPYVIAIDTIDNEVAAKIPLTHIAHTVVASEDLDILIATDPANQSVTIIDLKTREEIRSLNIGMRPDAAILNPFDRYVAFGSKDGYVSIWDMKTYKQMFKIDGLGSGENITFGFDGRELYVVDEKSKTISVIEMNTKAKVAEIDLGGPEDIHAEVTAISRSVDGFTGFVSITSENRVVVIDLNEWKVKKSISTGSEPTRPYSTADNRYILIPHREGKMLMVLSSLSHEVIATIPTQVKAKEINTGWLDTVAFIMPSEGKQISVVDLDALRHTGNITLSGFPDEGLVTSDSKTLYAALSNTGQIAVVDTRARTLKVDIETGMKGLKGIGIAISNNVCH
jgi:YVTN family beta-propeller protein